MTGLTNLSRHWYFGVVIAVGCCIGIGTAGAGSMTGMIITGGGTGNIGSGGGLSGLTGPSGPASGGAPNSGIVISVPAQSHAGDNTAYGFDGGWGKPLGHEFYDNGNLSASFTYYGAAGRGGSVQAVGLTISLPSN
jgi:hypothetical protein